MSVARDWRMMIDESLTRPDITLTLDSHGVIVEAFGSQELAEEDLRPWRGRNWRETVASEAGSRVTHAIAQWRRPGDSTLLQLMQTLPSGREAPIEYTMISLGRKAGFVALGRNLQSVADIQSRLAEAQQARERDYWKLREIETRYRALLDASQDAVALVRAETMRVVEANVAATKAMGLVPGSEFLPDLSARDQRALNALLAAVRGEGRAPGIALHLGGGAQWSLRASWIANEAGAFYCFQMTKLDLADTQAAKPTTRSLEDIIERLPDAFAVVDRDGVLKRANFAFLDLAQVGVEMAALGQPLSRWLSQPGADAAVALGLVARHGTLKRMSSRFEGDFGAGVDVEISAAGDRPSHPDFVGLLFQGARVRSDAEFRAEPSGEPAASSIPGPASDGTLEKTVGAAVEAIERRIIGEAMERCHANRTVAARQLGLSRQTLHAKLKKYRLVF